MRSTTAVEFGADICALARTTVSDGDVRLWAADTLDPAAFGSPDAFVAAIRHARRRLKLSKHCTAVVWGLPDGVRRRDPIVAPLVEPLTRAGFKVVRVVTPCNALGAIARLRLTPGAGTTCWLGVNRNGVAIVVVRPGKLLFSHSFAWNSSVGASGSQALLLQRYSLVSYLAPELRRALASARQKGSVVDRIVTCGNLPDLRALTMPLIEELDIEVETLDSLEGLAVTPEIADQLTAIAPAIRIACAAAIARETRSVDEVERHRVRRSRRVMPVVRAAAVLGLLALAAFWITGQVRAALNPDIPTSAAPRMPGPPAAPPLDSSAAAVMTGMPAPDAGTPSAATTPSLPSGDAIPPDVVIPPSGGTDSTGVAGSARPPASPSPSDVRVREPQDVERGSLSSSPPAADKPVATPTTTAIPAPRERSSAETVSEAAKRPMPAPLADPVPRVTAILVSAERRLATIEGRIVGVGETVGRRVVVDIDDRTVLLREPSGLRVRVALGGRVVGIERD